MRNLRLITLSTILCGLVALAGCSGGGAASGSSASSDAPLGKTPAIFAEVAAKKKALDETLRKEREIDSYQKKLKEFEEYAEKSYEKAAEEAQKIIGRDIVHTGDETYPDFQIKEVKVAEYVNSGTFVVRVKIAPRFDIEVQSSQYECAEGEYSLKETRLYCVFLTDDDHFISLGELNPFSCNGAEFTPKTEYTGGKSILTGSLCHSEGSPLYFYCSSFNYTDFAKIAFVDKQLYMEMRKQAYGF